MSALTIIYVPGLFDRTRFLLSAQWAALRLWRPLGARVRMFTVGWAGEIAWEERLAALIAMIDARHERGETVALVGASAGASAVLGAFRLAVTWSRGSAHLRENSPTPHHPGTYF